MPAANVVRAWQDGQFAYLAVAIAEPDEKTVREYIGRVPLEDIQDLNPSQVKAKLTAAVAEERARSIALAKPISIMELGISGHINV